MGSGDFLRQEAQTPWTGHYLMAGVSGSIATNCEAILAAARDCFSPVETPSSERRLRLRFFVDLRGTTQHPWPKPFFRGLDHLVFVGFDSQSAVLVDLRSRRAIGRFSPAMGADSDCWKSVIFPILISIMGATVGITELHCGCVSREGRGLLLVGCSGSGKSTLALALAQNGFAYLTDDRTYISSRDGRITAWGLPTHLKLRPDATEWFQKLEYLTPASGKNGERAWRIDPARELGVQRLQRCEPRELVFLERQEHPAFELSPMPRAEAAAQLEEDLIAEAPDVARRQRGAIANLVELPCWRLAYGGSPQAVAQEFSRRCW
jgi:hypothetical protein